MNTRRNHWESRDRRRWKDKHFKIHNRRFGEIIVNGVRKRNDLTPTYAPAGERKG